MRNVYGFLGVVAFFAVAYTLDNAPFHFVSEKKFTAYVRSAYEQGYEARERVGFDELEFCKKSFNVSRLK